MLTVGVVDVHLEHRDRAEHVVQVGLDGGHRPQGQRVTRSPRRPPGGSASRPDGAPPGRWPRRPRRARRRAGPAGRRCRSRGRGDERRARLDHPTEDQRVTQVLAARHQRTGSARRRPPGPVAHDGPAAAARVVLDELGRAQGGDRLAQRGAGDAHPARPARAPAAACCRAGRRPAGSPSPAARRTPRTRGGRAPRGARCPPARCRARGRKGRTRGKSGYPQAAASMV